MQPAGYKDCHLEFASPEDCMQINSGKLRATVTTTIDSDAIRSFVGTAMPGQPAGCRAVSYASHFLVLRKDCFAQTSSSCAGVPLGLMSRSCFWELVDLTHGTNPLQTDLP